MKKPKTLVEVFSAEKRAALGLSKRQRATIEDAGLHDGYASWMAGETTLNSLRRRGFLDGGVKLTPAGRVALAYLKNDKASE